MDRLSAAEASIRGLAYVVLGLASLALGALCAITVALGGLGRLADGYTAEDVWWLWKVRHEAEVQQWLRQGVLAGFGVALAALALILRPTPRPLHGAARWARTHEIARAGLRAQDGVLLGRHGGRLLSLAGAEHVLLAAPTRSGKGVGVVIPNLLAWRGSVVVLDIKRENWAATAGFRASHGQQVWLFDPLDPEGRTARFNPLGYINRHDPVEVIDELQKISTMLFPAHESADPFWAEAARTGFIGVGALVAASAERPFHIAEIYRELTRGDPRARLPALVKAKQSAGEPVSQPCESAILDFCSASDNTFASVRQTLTARMGLWLNPRVAAATAASDFDFALLRTAPTSIYLATAPENLPRLAPLYSLLFQQLIDATTRQGLADPDLHLPVLLLLDEFARLGPAKLLAQAFSYAAGYGLRLLPVLQSHAQLRALYGPDGASEIVSNCGAEVVFAPRTYPEAEALSQRLGYYGAPARSKSRPSGLSSGPRSFSESQQRRALMLPQELLSLPPEELIILRPGVAPIRGRKIIYWKDRIFRERLRPPPQVPPYATPSEPNPADDCGQPATDAVDAERDDLDLVLQVLSEEGLLAKLRGEPAGPTTQTPGGPARKGRGR